jgi:zinc transport system substrate-binding protein
MNKGKIFTAFLAVLLCVSGCSNKEKKAGARNVGNENKVAVTAAIFPPYDFARRIAGDRVELSMLLRPAAESHSFEPTPQDIITMQNSDLFIYIGGESDAWVKRILASMDDSALKKIKILPLINTVDAVEEEIVEGMEEEEEESGEDAAYDEHIWTSPRNAVLMVRAIADALCEIDSGNAAFYRANAESYTAELNELDAAFKDVVAGGKRKTIVFGDRFPFRYFADAYGLSYYAAFPGCSTETEPSAATVAFLIDKIKSEKIPVVFHIELSNERMADAIAAETGAKKLLFHSCHNISKKDFENGAAYLDLMRGNVDNLREALR